MMINIAKDCRKYSSEELRDLAYRGLLEANGLDLSDFLGHIFQDMHSQAALDKAVEEALKEAKYSASYSLCAECEDEIY